MDRRSWPWKKKSSDKAAAEKAIAGSDSTGSQVDQAKQDSHKKPSYVQISVESYSHLTGLENQVKSYEDQVKNIESEIVELNEQLSAAHSEMTTKDNLVKQHAKVAEEAVSGWEKAESEASALKNHLESVTLLKLTAEDRASHFDGALKECMRKIRNLQEEHEQTLHDTVLTKTKQLDKVKLEFEAKIANLDQELLRSAAENAALSRSLQERSNMLIKISEEKSQAEAEIELLRSNIGSCDREINSLKYELHIATKELEIRNEEKNMSVRSAEVANKQHLEGVKKIAKLEAECQRLRGLVRKKLPGPAALAQMKLEVESLGRDYGETRLRKSPIKPSSPHLSPMPEFSLDNGQKYHKENGLLTDRLFAIEEETKMLKEALAKRNSELLASRNMCANTFSKLQSLEAQLQANGELKNPTKSNVQVPIEGSFSNLASNPPSLTSMSEDGNDDEVSCSGSCATMLISESTNSKKEKDMEIPEKAESASHLELMDDFLEMEKLACLSNDSNGVVSSSGISINIRPEGLNHENSVKATFGSDSESKQQHDSDALESEMATRMELTTHNPHSDAEELLLMKLQSRVSAVFDSVSKDADMDTVLDRIRHIVQDIHGNLHRQPMSSVVEASCGSDGTNAYEASLPDSMAAAEKNIPLCCDSKPDKGTVHDMRREIVAAISQIHDFVLFLSKEGKSGCSGLPDGDQFNQKLEQFSATFTEVVNEKRRLDDFVLALSHVLAKAYELQLNVLGYKNNEAETNTSDCIDKVALPENKVFQDSSRGRYHFCDSASDVDIPHEASFIPTVESTATTWKCSLEEFEQLKLEKDTVVVDLARCTENLESTKSQLLGTEQLLAEVRSQLASAQKLNSLADTQLKCMAESYKSLETRAEELQTEVNRLRVKAENLDIELQEERKSHYDALSRCKDLQEQLQRIENCQSDDTNNAQTNQDRELASAAEKLAECQETIYLLGKQLKSFRPQTEFAGSTFNERSQKGEDFAEEPTTSGMNLQEIDPSKMDTATSASLRRVGGESPKDIYNILFSPSDSETSTPLRSPISPRHPKHRPTKSGSSSSSSSAAPMPEKPSRGFSRFFSSKGKNGY